jgi:nicotinic acid phosphoribosyltransferase
MVKDSEKNIQFCESCGENLNLAFGVGAIKTADNNNRLKI